ncbi:MAG: hypothetical protein V7L20_14675 [Nostoc sp.]|uniref:hypothetical protein n=1 Tax=Nostoc sp. TaxID=1180 RepID=UPI002FFB4ACD
MTAQPTPKNSLPIKIVTERNFIDWLQSQQMSLAFTIYQSSRLMLLGANSQGQMSVFDW